MADEKEKDSLWESLKEKMDQKEVFTVTVKSAVPGGVVTELEGLRAFIPVSQLAAGYVEDTASWVGKEVRVQIITVDEEKKNLVLSGKEIAKKEREEERNQKIEALVPGTVVEGTVESIMPYGAFVNIGDGISGLVHISRISRKHVEDVASALKKGQKVRAKITGVKDHKVSLSMRELEEPEEEISERPKEKPSEDYISGERASTSLGDILSKLEI